MTFVKRLNRELDTDSLQKEMNEILHDYKLIQEFANEEDIPQLQQEFEELQGLLTVPNLLASIEYEYFPKGLESRLEQIVQATFCIPEERYSEYRSGCISNTRLLGDIYEELLMLSC